MNWQVFKIILEHDLLLAYRQRNEIFYPLIFFIIVVTLFPLAITLDENLLQTIAPGIIWVGALLATLLSINHLFRDDFNDGTLEQFILSTHSLSLLVITKIIVYWLSASLPLIIVSPLLAFLLHMTNHSILVLLLSLLLGTPLLCFIGGITAALTVALHQNSVLLALLTLPLYIPVLIFGAGSVRNAMLGLPAAGGLIMLAAMLVLALTLAPFAIVGALKLSVE